MKGQMKNTCIEEYIQSLQKQDIRKDSPLLAQGPYRKTRSAEQLKHYHCSNPLPQQKQLSFASSSSGTNRSDTINSNTSSTSTSTTPTITTSSTTPYLDECSIDMDLIYTDF